MRITGLTVRLYDTGLVEVNATVGKARYDMHVIPSGNDGSPFAIATNFGLNLIRAYSWDVEYAAAPEMKKMAVAMFNAAEQLIIANKPDPEPEEEPEPSEDD